MDAHGHGGRSDKALRRVLASAGLAELLDVLSERLDGSDLTTLLMEVMRQRASRLTPRDVVRRFDSDRFVASGTIAFERLRSVEDRLLSLLPRGFELVTLAPLVPLGTHSAVAAVDQNMVVSTVRASEVAADPTSGLALEAGARRRRAIRARTRNGEPVRLAALQRITRAQRFEAEGALTHFTILGLVTAGHAEPNRGFERRAITEHVRFLSDGLLALGAEKVVVSLTDFSEGRLALALDAIIVASQRSRVEVVSDPQRDAGRRYYEEFALDVSAVIAGERFSVADGGLVDWGKKLVVSGKERMLISGIGVDRVASICA